VRVWNNWNARVSGVAAFGDLRVGESLSIDFWDLGVGIAGASWDLRLELLWCYDHRLDESLNFFWTADWSFLWAQLLLESWMFQAAFSNYLSWLLLWAYLLWVLLCTLSFWLIFWTFFCFKLRNYVALRNKFRTLLIWRTVEVWIINHLLMRLRRHWWWRHRRTCLTWIFLLSNWWSVYWCLLNSMELRKVWWYIFTSYILLNKNLWLKHVLTSVRR